MCTYVYIHMYVCLLKKITSNELIPWSYATKSYKLHMQRAEVVSRDISKCRSCLTGHNKVQKLSHGTYQSAEVVSRDISKCRSCLTGHIKVQKLSHGTYQSAQVVSRDITALHNPQR